MSNRKLLVDEQFNNTLNQIRKDQMVGRTVQVRFFEDFKNAIHIDDLKKEEKDENRR